MSMNKEEVLEFCRALAPEIVSNLKAIFASRVLDELWGHRVNVKLKTIDGTLTESPASLAIMFAKIEQCRELLGIISEDTSAIRDILENAEQYETGEYDEDETAGYEVVAPRKKAKKKRRKKIG